MKIAVIQGGPSTEAEVSRASAAAVVGALGRAGHEARTFELEPDLGAELMEYSPDAVFPVAHGELGEDGSLQGLLEVLGLPYVGSGVLASALATDKVSAKVFFARAGLAVARQKLVDRARFERGVDEGLLAECRSELGPRFIIKPSGGGSTIGVTRLLDGATLTDFQAGLAAALALDGVALLETYHAGVEVNCGVLEGPQGAQALPPTQIVPVAADWYDFASKYSTGGSRHLCPAPLDAELARRIQAAAVAAHRALGARDLSRSDFIIDPAGEFIVLELNSLPGMTAVSLYPEAAQAAGISFEELVDRLVKRAAARRVVRQPRAQPLPA